MLNSNLNYASKSKTDAAKILLNNGWTINEVNGLLFPNAINLSNSDGRLGQHYQGDSTSFDYPVISATPFLDKASFEVPNSGVGYAIRGKKNSKLKGVKFK